MIKLSDLILEATAGPKVIVMAGGSGAGKTSPPAIRPQIPTPSESRQVRGIQTIRHTTS